MPINTNIAHLEEFQAELKTHKKNIVMFTATWCGPCKIIKPAFSQYSENKKYESINFIQIDVDEADEICIKYKIRSMPTFVMFVNESEVCERVVGADRRKLENVLDSVLA